MSTSVQLKSSTISRVTEESSTPSQDPSPFTQLATLRSLDSSPRLPFPLPLTTIHPRNVFDSMQFVKPLRMKVGGIGTLEKTKSKELAKIDLSETEKSQGKDRTELSESKGKLVEIRKSSPRKVKESCESGDKSPSKSLQPSPIARKSLSLDHLPELPLGLTLTLTPIPEHTKASPLPVKQSTRLDFVPYTLKDYHMMLSPPTMGVGALGAATLGSEDWAKRKQFENRRKAYARVTFQRNSNQIAISSPRKPFKPSPPSSSRLRGIEFAKKLHLPEVNHSLTQAEIQELRSFAAEMKARLLA